MNNKDPKLQSIPIRTELGKELRLAFIEENGERLAEADYSQIELRIIAHFDDVKRHDNKVSGFRALYGEAIYGDKGEEGQMSEKSMARAVQRATDWPYTRCLTLIRNLLPSARDVKSKNPGWSFKTSYTEAIHGHFKHADPTLSSKVLEELLRTKEQK